MKILSCRVDWKLFNDGLPEFIFHVDRIPELKELTFQNKGGAYFAEKNGYVKFFYHNKYNQSGYGGRSFRINTLSGMVEIIGPWSSNARAMNELGFTRSLDVILTAGKYLMAGAITSDLLHSCYKSLENPEFHIVEYDGQFYPSLLKEVLVKPRQYKEYSGYVVFESKDRRYLIEDLKELECV